jgi:RsiW-degrading membrane proteinase PrsW (M82 family)
MESVYGILIGGSLISALGALSTYNVENKKPTMKSITRDFIIGSVLFLLIMQLLPESSSSMIQYIASLIPSGLPTISSSVDDLDIQVGIPKF